MKHLLLICGLSFASIATTQSANLTTTAQFNVPEIGSGVGLIDQQKERSIGEKVYREVQRKMPVTQNPWLEDQLINTFSHLLSQTQSCFTH